MTVKKKGVWNTCPECGVKHYKCPSMANRLRCSKKCANLYIKRLYSNDEKRKEQLRIAAKNVDYKARNARAHETLRKHIKEGKIKFRTGADNNLWRGGVATLQNSVRNSAKYKAWRTAVYERDDFKCRECGTNKDLHAHHIKAFAKYPDLRYEVDNGITLCREHHSKVHGRYLPDISKANKLLT